MSLRSRSGREKKGAPQTDKSSLIKRIGPRTTVALLVALTLVSLSLAGGLLYAASSGGESSSGSKTAAIVDQLSLTQPNPDFISSARSLLGEAGYTVDYFPGERVTVDFYRTLPQRDYDLILLIVHAGITT